MTGPGRSGQRPDLLNFVDATRRLDLVRDIVVQLDDRAIDSVALGSFEQLADGVVGAATTGNDVLRLAHDHLRRPLLLLCHQP